jgi:hypothetical protein
MKRQDREEDCRILLTSRVIVEAKARANPAKEASIRVKTEMSPTKPMIALESRLNREESHRFTIVIRQRVSDTVN